MVEQRSRFGINLVSQAILLSMAQAFAQATPVPFNKIFMTLSVLLSWAFSIGLVYGFFRMFGARGSNFEAFYQNFPIGSLKAMREALEGDANQTSGSQGMPSESAAAMTQRMDEAKQRKKNWEQFLSVDFVRYAGLLLIISSIFAFLFRINWSLTAKITASAAGALAGLGLAEFTRARSHLRTAGFCFLVAVALAQFTCTLLFKYFLLFPDSGKLAQVETWLTIKTLLSVAGTLCISRYYASFVPIVFFLIVYATPLSLSSIEPDLPLYPGLAFTLAASVVALCYAVCAKYSVALLNICCATVFALSFARMGAADSLLSQMGPLAANERNFAVFLSIGILFLMHTLAGAFHAMRLHKSGGAFVRQDWTVAILELVSVQGLIAVSLCAVQYHVGMLKGYSGITLLVMSLVTFGSYIAVVKEGVRNEFSEVLLNCALIVSGVGMFLQTEGAWTAIVFLLFSCAAIYVSFVLGTLRTRVYAFCVLAVSMLKLYFECSELFDSISGSAMVLLIGIILMVLSYKIEALKELMRPK